MPLGLLSESLRVALSSRTACAETLLRFRGINRTTMKFSFALLFAAFFASIHAADKPNIIFILVDDGRCSNPSLPGVPASAMATSPGYLGCVLTPRSCGCSERRERQGEEVPKAGLHG